MAVSKSQRVLIIVSYLSPKNKFNFYNFVEASGIATAKLILKSKYSSIEVLKDSEATKNKFLSKISTFAAKSSIKAIDVIMMTHGNPGKLYFYDASESDKDVAVKSSTLKSDIRALKNYNKLRLLYSTACYGDSHSDDFLGAGFNASVGSVGVNSNSASEFPIVCELWGKGDKISTAVYWGEMGYKAFDLIAKAAGFKDANSDKNVRGNGSLRIDSDS